MLESGVQDVGHQSGLLVAGLPTGIPATEGSEKVRHHSDGYLIMHPPMRTLVCQTILSPPSTYAGVLRS